MTRKAAVLFVTADLLPGRSLGRALPAAVYSHAQQTAKQSRLREQDRQTVPDTFRVGDGVEGG
jgi:hypothetical protein